MRVGRDVSRTRQEGVRGRSVFFGDLLPFRDDGVDRLVPTDLLPLAFAAFADALHGVFDAVFSVNAQRMGDAFVADAGDVFIGLLAARCLDDLAVAHMHVHLAAGAASAAARAGRDDFFGTRGLFVFVGVRLRQHARRLQGGACGDGGGRRFQEAAAFQACAQYALSFGLHGFPLLRLRFRALLQALRCRVMAPRAMP